MSQLRPGRIRVLIVEDSAVVAEHLRRIISADPRFQVAGVAPSGEEALRMVGSLSPDVISMDIHLPGIQGLEATRRIMARHPTPIVVVSGVRSDEIPLTMEALRAGALSVVEKPVAVTHDSYAALASRLCTQLAIMSEVKVLKQREEQQPQQPHPAPSDGRPAPLSAVLTRAVEAPPLGSYRLLAIAASTGGPSALMRLLSGLGPRFPLPIAVVQHMTPAFLGGFAEWLASVTPFPVTIVNAPTTLEPGHVYLAPSQDLHLAVHGSTAAPDNSPAEGVHRPSANVLFSSVARAFGSAALGVVLTGMGDDGTQGLLELRSAGAWVIAEHESTSAVYGMPAAAIEAGAVNETLPLPEIAPRILKVIGLQAKPA